MKVVLKRNYFGPDGALYSKHPEGKSIEMPDEFRGVLPKDAKIIETGQPEPVAREQIPVAGQVERKPRDVVAEMSHESAASDREAEIRSKAEKFAEELAAEQAASASANKRGRK